MPEKPCTTSALEQRINKLEIESGAFGVSLEKDVAALEKQMGLQFKATETAVNAALAAQKELVNAAFASSEKAITKAENAQTSYNQTHNDLSRKMDNQYKEMIPRTEVDGRLAGLEDKIATQGRAIEDKLATQANVHDKALEVIREDIKDLRGTRKGGLHEGWGWAAAVVALAFAVFQFISKHQ